jgi:hypothetical protein
VGNLGRTGGPFRHALQIDEVEGVDELARDHRVGGGRVAEIGGEAAAGERAGGDKALVLVGADLEG